MHSNELALQVGRKLRDFDTVLASHPGEFVAIILRFRSLPQIDQLARPCGNLHPGIAFFGSPFGDAIPCVERRFIACKLPKKNPGAFDCLHQISPESARTPPSTGIEQFESALRAAYRE